MAKKLIQHVPVEPHWPEMGVRLEDGSPIRLADVEKLLPAGEGRANVYYLDGKGNRVWPWREAGYYVDEDGEAIAPVGPMPMSRRELEGLGLSDELLSDEHAAYFGTGERIDPHAEDTDAVRMLRRKLYDEFTDAAYSGKKRIHGH